MDSCTRDLLVRKMGGNPSAWEVRPVEVWTLATPSTKWSMRNDLESVYGHDSSGLGCTVAPSLARVALAVADRLLGRNYTALHVRGGDVIQSAQRYVSPGNVARVLHLASPYEGGAIFVMSNEPRSVVEQMVSQVRGRHIVLSQDILSLPIVKRLAANNNYILFMLESVILRLATTRVTTFAAITPAALALRVYVARLNASTNSTNAGRASKPWCPFIFFG